MKKRNLKPVILSTLVALGLGATAVGTTFALFTDRADTKIDVLAGIVDIDQEITITSVSELNGVAVAKTGNEYINSVGGKTYINADGKLVLERWVPGDKAVLEAVYTNHSNVDIKTKFSVSKGQLDDTKPNLDEVLEITYDVIAQNGSPITQDNFDQWTKVESSVETISKIKITIEFPDGDDGEILYGDENADNPYQDGNAVYQFSQEAVQGNAHTPDTSKGYEDSYEKVIDNVTYEVNELASTEHFEQMLTDLKSVDPTDAEEVEAAKKTIYKLDADIDLEDVEDLNKGVLYGTIDGDGHKIKNASLTSADSADKKSLGLFGSYFDGAAIKNLTVSNVDIDAAAVQNVGLLVGQSYKNAKSDSTVDEGSVLTLENITIESTCSITGSKGVGGLIGNVRYVETVKAKNVKNYATINSNGWNNGGFFGTATGVKHLIMEDCENHGDVYGTTNNGGFVGHLPDVLSITIKNCKNYGNMYNTITNKTTDRHYTNTSLSDVAANDSRAGYFVAMTNNLDVSMTYTGNYNEGVIYYKEALEGKMNVIEAPYLGNGIEMEAGKTADDYLKVDTTADLQYTINSNNEFVITPVANATSYQIIMSITIYDCTISGNTVTVVEASRPNYMKTYESVEALQSGFGRITKAGYVLNSQYTEYDETYSSGKTHVEKGTANYYRLPYANKANYTLNEVYKLNNEWVFVLDGDASAVPGTCNIMSPKDTEVAYVINAFDANGNKIASVKHTDGAVNGSPFVTNFAGDVYTRTSGHSDHTYDPVA